MSVPVAKFATKTTWSCVPRTRRPRKPRFRARVSLAAKDEDLAWREGEHDDLVLAVAAAVWHGRSTGAVLRLRELEAILAAGR